MYNKRMVTLSSDFKLFGMVPPERRRPGTGWAFDKVEVIGSPPRIFLQGTLIGVDGLSIVCLILILFTRHPTSVLTIIGTGVLFLLCTLLLLHTRKSARFPIVLLDYSLVSVLSLLLNLFFPGNWGNIWMIGVCGFTIYRFPPRWVWPLLSLNIVLLAATNGLLSFVLFHRSSTGYNLLTVLIILVVVCWVGFSRRNRDLLFIQLQNVQAQLRAEMARTEELATARERTRIARDIHDVLAHTLTILSIQIQAARQLVRQDPERLASKLDEMAVLLKESIAESRRVVGLLRETALTSAEPGNAVTRLRAQVERFGERTGIRCVFEESGKAMPLSEKQVETLQYALQETLTNAHRHGSARQVVAELQWQDRAVLLSVRDDGLGEAAPQSSEGTGHGLQGMRERVAASGGTVEAGSQAQGGFVVTMQLPLDTTVTAQLQGGKD